MDKATQKEILTNATAGLCRLAKYAMVSYFLEDINWHKENAALVENLTDYEKKRIDFFERVLVCLNEKHYSVEHFEALREDYAPAGLMASIEAHRLKSHVPISEGANGMGTFGETELYDFKQAAKYSLLSSILIDCKLSPEELKEICEANND